MANEKKFLSFERIKQKRFLPRDATELVQAREPFWEKSIFYSPTGYLTGCLYVLDLPMVSLKKYFFNRLYGLFPASSADIDGRTEENSNHFIALLYPEFDMRDYFFGHIKSGEYEQHCFFGYNRKKNRYFFTVEFTLREGSYRHEVRLNLHINESACNDNGFDDIHSLIDYLQNYCHGSFIPEDLEEASENYVPDGYVIREIPADFYVLVKEKGKGLDKDKKYDPSSESSSHPSDSQKKKEDSQSQSRPFQGIPWWTQFLPEGEDEKNTQIGIQLPTKEERRSWQRLSSKAAEYGYDCGDMRQYGNFFHMVADQNKAQQNCYADLTYKVVRERTIEHILQHPETYAPLLVFDSLPTFIIRLAQGQGWSESMVSTALSRALKVNLVIIYGDGKKPLIVRRHEPVATLYLGCEMDWCYQSLRFNVNLKPSENLQNMVNEARIDGELPLKVMTLLQPGKDENELKAFYCSPTKNSSSNPGGSNKKPVSGNDNPKVSVMRSRASQKSIQQKKVSTHLPKYPTDIYVRISKGKIGRLDTEEKPPQIRGLCTGEFSSSNIFNVLVFISTDKNRYVLIHIDAEIDLQLIRDQIIWVGGNANLFSIKSGSDNSTKALLRKLRSEFSFVERPPIIVENIKVISVSMGDDEPKLIENLPKNLIFHEGHLIFQEEGVAKPFLQDALETQFSSCPDRGTEENKRAEKNNSTVTNSSHPVNPLFTHDYTPQDIANLVNVNLGTEWERINIGDAELGNPIYYMLFRRNDLTNQQIIFPPVTRLQDRDLTESLKDMWIRAQPYLGGAQEVLIPFNPGRHWVLLRITLGENKIVYLDSFDYEEDVDLETVASSTIDGFREYLGGTQSFNTARLQLDQHSCGVVVVDNILDIVNGQGLPKRFFSPEDILERRKEHQEMLNQWDLSLEMNQITTSISPSNIKISETVKPSDLSQAETMANNDEVSLPPKEAKITPEKPPSANLSMATLLGQVASHSADSHPVLSDNSEELNMAGEIKTQKTLSDNAEQTGDETLGSTVGKYIYILEGKVGRMDKDGTPENVIGLCTGDITSCNIVVLISANRKKCSLIHVDKTITTATIQKELQWVGKSYRFIFKRPDNSSRPQSSTNEMLARKYSSFETILMSPEHQIILIDRNIIFSPERFSVRSFLEKQTPHCVSYHHHAALIYAHHGAELSISKYIETGSGFNVRRIEVPKDPENFLDPLLYDGTKWADYKSFELSAYILDVFSNAPISMGFDFKIDSTTPAFKIFRVLNPPKNLRVYRDNYYGDLAASICAYFYLNSLTTTQPSYADFLEKSYNLFINDQKDANRHSRYWHLVEYAKNQLKAVKEKSELSEAVRFEDYPEAVGKDVEFLDNLEHHTNIMQGDACQLMFFKYMSPLSAVSSFSAPTLTLDELKPSHLLKQHDAAADLPAVYGVEHVPEALRMHLQVSDKTTPQSTSSPLGSSTGSISSFDTFPYPQIKVPRVETGEKSKVVAPIAPGSGAIAGKNIGNLKTSEALPMRNQIKTALETIIQGDWKINVKEKKAYLELENAQAEKLHDHLSKYSTVRKGRKPAGDPSRMAVMIHNLSLENLNSIPPLNLFSQAATI